MYIETPEDLARKYRETYVMYDNQIAFVHGFSGEDDRVNIHFMLKESKGMVQERFEADKLQEIMPDAQFINSFHVKKSGSRSCFAVYRNPRRQWQRSLSAHNVTVVSPLRTLYERIKKHPPELGVSYVLAEAVQKREYPTLDWALKHLPTFKAIAISERYAIVPSILHPAPTVLWCSYATGFIGTLTNNELELYHHTEEQEIRDYIHQHRLSIRVTLCPVPPLKP